MIFSCRPLFRAISTAVLAVLIVLPDRGAAQQRPASRSDTLSARARDSLLAAVLADTLDLDLDTLALLPPPQRRRQSFTLRPTVRSYSVGSLDASEQAAYANWVLRFPRATLRVDMTPIAYAGDTSTTSGPPQSGFSGASPIAVRLDVPLRVADTLRVFGQSMSFPGALSAVDAQALGAVGTSTIDLDAGAIGVAARVGVRYALTQAIGDGGTSISLRAGAEYDPKPTGSNVVSWRGTTVRGGVGVSHATPLATVGVGAEVTRSFADSLGGLNLFPGGGAINLDARALRFFGEGSDGYVALNGFYSRPFGLERNDQPTRLIPIGDFGGVTASVSLPVGRLSLLPTVSHLREASSAAAIVSGRPVTLAASGNTSTVSLGLAIPLGTLVTLTPEVGGAFGSVGQVVSAQFPRRVRSRSFSDPIRGGWVALEITMVR